MTRQPMTNGLGTWAVIDAVTGFPIESNSGLTPQFSIRDLLQFDKDVQEGRLRRSSASFGVRLAR